MTHLSNEDLLALDVALVNGLDVHATVEALVAKHRSAAWDEGGVQALRMFADDCGVDISDDDSEWIKGYRQAQREAILKATAHADQIAAAKP